MRVFQVSKTEMNFPKKKSKVNHIIGNIKKQFEDIGELEFPNVTEDLKEGFYATSNENIFIKITK